MAALALPQETAAFLHHRAAPTGLGYVEPGERGMWRFLALSAFPPALLAFALVRRLAR